MKYTVNFAGFLFWIPAALLIFGVIPIDSLSQNETIVASLLLVLFSDSVKLEIKSSNPAIGLLVWPMLVIFAAVSVYGFATLLT